MSETVAERDRLIENGACTVSGASTEVFEVDPLVDPRWPELVATHPLASIFHTRDWLRALKHTYGYRPLVLTTCPPNAQLTEGIVFCEVRSWLTGRRLVSLPFSDHCHPLFDGSDALSAVLAYGVRLIEKREFKRLEVRPHSVLHADVERFWPKGGAVLHRLNITPSAEELFRSFHKDCIQRKIRRAERENLVYEEGRSEEQLKDFYRLMVMTRRRHGLPPQPLEWFKALISFCGSKLKIRIVRKDGEAVASIVTLSHRKTMVYKYGCSDASANKYGGTPMLFWRTIQEAKENGQELLDMGRSDLDDPGLSVFKEHWGAVPTPLIYLKYPGAETKPHSKWQHILKDRIIAASSDRVLQLAGSVLYRHIG